MAQSPGDRVAATHLEYDAVIATRNRPDALALSLPLLVGQTRPPRRLIVIDSSDDHAPVAAAVAKSVTGWNGDLVIEHSAKGLPLQRNRGLAHVTAPVVLFPDDDSLLYPDAAEQILAVYERDRDAAIAAVCALEAMEPPGDASAGAFSYVVADAETRKRRFRGVQGRIERKFTWLKPAKILGRHLNARHAVPEWLGEVEARPVEYMTGFRMSFRTHAIRRTGFDEALRDYGLYEDIDASFSAGESGLVVAAWRSKIYHHRFPGARANGRALGMIEVLNMVYVILKHATPERLGTRQAGLVRRRLAGFVPLRVAADLVGVGSAFGRQRLIGAATAALWSGRLWRAAGDTLADVYRTAMSRGAS